MSKPYTVIATLLAKAGKELELKELLTGVVAPSRHESTCIDYRLHQDLNNPAQFIIYENWQNKYAHQMQFQKPYIIDLIGRLNQLLACAYTVVFAEEL